MAKFKVLAHGYLVNTAAICAVCGRKRLQADACNLDLNHPRLMELMEGAEAEALANADVWEARSGICPACHRDTDHFCGNDVTVRYGGTHLTVSHDSSSTTERDRVITLLNRDADQVDFESRAAWTVFRKTVLAMLKEVK